jgi:putative ABC transport system permease protein
MRLESLWQDIRYAARGLRQKPGFALAVIVTLGLGIGANAAMFGVTDRLLFRAPSYMKDPDRTHRVYVVRTWEGKENFGAWFQYTRFKDLERWTTSFDAYAAVTDPNAAVGTGESAREMRIAAVSAGFWKLFEAQPVLGRFFGAPEDTTPVGAQVVVLSDVFWRTEFGGRADAIGQTIKIARADYTIIGVTPPGFHGITERMPMMYVPITTWAGNEMAWNPSDPTNWFQKYNMSWMQMFVRRKPGVLPAQADADLAQAERRSYAAQRQMSPGTTVEELAKPRAIAAPISLARGPNASPVSKVARWVSGVALIVLLVAAANVANLLLARALKRRREVAVRLALGVSRARLLSQLLAESVLLALLGGVAGVLVAQWGGAILRTQFLPYGEKVSVLSDQRTLWFAAAATLAVGILTGLVPALQSGRGDLTSALKSGSREGTYHRSRTRTALLILQGALSVVLLVGAGLFVRSLSNVHGLRLGYDVDRLLWVNVRERGERLDSTQKALLRDRLADAARTLPNVENAARAVTVPYMMTWNENIHVQGRDTAWLNALGSINIQGTTPEYLATMGTRLLRGRFLTAADTRGSARVMVISEAMANTIWPKEDPIGACVRIGADTNPCTEVVGIAENIRSASFSDDKQLYYYRPIGQADWMGGGIFVRTRGDAEGEGESVRRALQALMPGSSYVTVQPMSQIFGPNIQSWKLGATMFVAFGGLALLLAAIGLYSVIAYNVVQRTHELGVRVAFGAQAPDVVRLILREGLQLTTIGILIGAGIALVAGRWVAPLLFEVSPKDPVVFTAVAGTLLLVATLACMIPALRAARVDPNVALRSD